MFFNVVIRINISRTLAAIFIHPFKENFGGPDIAGNRLVFQSIDNIWNVIGKKLFAKTHSQTNKVFLIA